MTVKLQPVFAYQDCLRAVGACLDVRGNREIRIVEDADALVVEAASGKGEATASKEVTRLHVERIQHLRLAALNDRGAPWAMPSRSTDQQLNVLVMSQQSHRRPIM